MEVNNILVNVRERSYLVSYDSQGQILQMAVFGSRIVNIEWDDIPPFDQEFIQRFVFNQLFNPFE